MSRGRTSCRLHKLALPTLLPGVTVSSRHSKQAPIKALRLMRWDGKSRTCFGDIIAVAGS